MRRVDSTPSSGSIFMSIRTTSGRLPSASRRSRASSASTPPSTSATMSRSGSLPRKASRPWRTTAWSSTMRIRIRRSSGSILSRSQRRLDPYHSYVFGRAGDSEGGTDLVRAGLHRFEAVVAGLAALGVEAAAVITNLEMDGFLTHSNPDGGGRRVCVPDGVHERLAHDPEQLRLRAMGDRQAVDRPRDVDGELRLVRQLVCVLADGGHEPVLDRVLSELEDQPAHLRLGTPRELPDRGKCACDRARHADLVIPEGLLGRPRLQDRREKRLRDRVVEVPRNSVTLRERLPAFAALRLDERGGRLLALAQQRREQQRGQRDDADVELRPERLAVDLLTGERAEIVRRQADRRSGHEHQRTGRARSSDAPHTTGAVRDYQVGDSGFGRACDPGEQQDRGEE